MKTEAVETTHMYSVPVTREPGHEKMCLMPYENNKGADQPGHPRSLISIFVVRCLGIVPILAKSKISRLQPVFVNELSYLVANP